jgi:hypothetical protein
VYTKNETKTIAGDAGRPAARGLFNSTWRTVKAVRSHSVRESVSSKPIAEHSYRPTSGAED